MFFDSIKITGSALCEVVLLGALGYFLVKKRILGNEGLDNLSRLVIDVILPVMIFCQILRGFSFSEYRTWWLFPLVSIAITVVGLLAGSLFAGFISGRQQKMQFLSLIAFQNSGYLPLALIGALLPKEKAGSMFIYLFLFLIGFNLVMFSLGVYMLSAAERKKFAFLSLFSAPVVATLIAFVCVGAGLNKIFPDALFFPLKKLGDCTVPLAMLVVGGNLANITVAKVNIRAMGLMALVKLILMPLLGLWFVWQFKVPELIGLLLIIELAVPPATTLSAIVSSYKQEDFLISQGIFVGHVASLVTLPLFLSLYFAFCVVK